MDIVFKFDDIIYLPGQPPLQVFILGFYLLNHTKRTSRYPRWIIELEYVTPTDDDQEYKFEYWL